MSKVVNVDALKAWIDSNSFEQNVVPKFTVSVVVVTAAGGVVSPSSKQVDQGGSAIFTVTINAGYAVSVSVGSLSGNVWTIPNVTANQIATATFAKATGRPVPPFPSLGPFGPYPNSKDSLQAFLASVTSKTSPIAVWAQWVKNNPGDMEWVWEEFMKTQGQVIPDPPTSVWTKIASEGESFIVSGSKTARYGAGTNWIEKVVTGTCQCTNTFFGKDPIPGAIKSCELSSETPAEPVPVPDPTPIPPAPVGWTPITGYISGTPNMGAAGTLVVGQTSQYSFLLLDELPEIHTADIWRAALKKGQNYSQFVVYLSATDYTAKFELKVIAPDGTVANGSPGEALWTAFILNAVPGRYKISCKLLSVGGGGTSAFYRVVPAPEPSIMPSELAGK